MYDDASMLATGPRSRFRPEFLDQEVVLGQLRAG
jgi:hypothetical protein